MAAKKRKILSLTFRDEFSSCSRARVCVRASSRGVTENVITSFGMNEKAALQIAVGGEEEAGGGEERRFPSREVHRVMPLIP